MADYHSAFSVLNAVSGTVDTASKAVAAGQHILVPVWGYDTAIASGDLVYLKDGGGEVSLGAPIQQFSRTGNSDECACFLLRAPAAGNYVIRSKNNSYRVAPPIVFTAQPNFWIRVSANSEGTGTTFTSAAVVPYWTDSLAIGYATHNSDGGGSTLSAQATWTLIHKQEDYDGAYQPGIAQYKKLASTSSLTSAPTCDTSVSYMSLLIVISDPPDVYMLTGGTTSKGFFGTEDGGGADSTGDVQFPFGGIPADQAIAVGLSLYDYTPADASLMTIAGAGNSLTKTAGIDDGASNDASYTWFHTPTPLASTCTSVGYDGTSLPAGDAGRYGQIVALVMRYPDTVNGIYTATAVTNVQTSATALNAGTLTLPTTNCAEVWGCTIRGHASDLQPVVVTPTEFETHLRHVQWAVTSEPPTDYPCWHNSTIISGPAGAKVTTGGGTSSITVTLDAATGSGRTVHTAYNLAGGTVPGGGGTLLPIMQAHHG
jgi:hypothetical protein